jgi:methoxymalonate biosynthesis protein
VVAVTDPVKCVVWDLDGTIWPEVAVELPPGSNPHPRPEALRAMTTLEERGIVNSLASRTDPSVAEVVERHPDLAGRFVAGQLSWGHKSDAIHRVATDLGIAPGAIAFVDDDPFERAEVAAMLPEVEVLSPAELYERLDTPRFAPAVVTEDGRRRPERYRQEQHRRAAEADFRGDRERFLRDCRMALTIRPAGVGQLDRLVELVERTHRFNSTGASWSREWLGRLLADPDWLVTVARLTDRFGDYGLIGAALVERGHPAWRLHLFTVSCRVAGRGVPTELLRSLMATARAAGSQRLLMDVRAQPANLELRVLLRRCGFQAAGDGLLSRALAAGLPDPVPWLTVHEETVGA